MSFLNEKSDLKNNAENERIEETFTTEEKKENPYIELVRFVLIALLIVVPIRYFIAQPFIVSGASMEETFHNNEYLIVDQLTYHFEDPKRGDVIIFRYPNDPSKFFIKRIIGMPGDTITVDNSTVKISNSELSSEQIITEPYIKSMKGDSYLKQTLDESEYFVMGDNRDASSDSRIWGVLPRENIVGRAFLRLIPLGEAGLLPGAYDEVDMSLINI